jgi:hypothetical protein
MKTKGFKISEKSEVGTHHIVSLPNLTSQKVKELFGKLPKGTGKNNKYSEAIVLEHESIKPIQGNYPKPGANLWTLYTSFGMWRIGGFEKANTTCAYVGMLIELLNSAE